MGNNLPKLGLDRNPKSGKGTKFCKIRNLLYICSLKVKTLFERGLRSPFVLEVMKDAVLQMMEPILEAHGLFLVEFQSPTDQQFRFFVDGMEHVSIDTCSKVARELRESGGEVLDAYEITVSSPGLDRPFRHPLQYQKNIGRLVEVLMNDGQKIVGELMEAGEEYIELRPVLASRHKGAARKFAEEPVKLPRTEIRQTQQHIVF